MKKLLRILLPLLIISLGFYLTVIVDCATRRIGFSDDSPTIDFKIENGVLSYKAFAAQGEINVDFSENKEWINSICEYLYCLVSPFFRSIAAIISNFM